MCEWLQTALASPLLQLWYNVNSRKPYWSHHHANQILAIAWIQKSMHTLWAFGRNSINSAMHIQSLWVRPLWFLSPSLFTCNFVYRTGQNKRMFLWWRAPYTPFVWQSHLYTSMYIKSCSVSQIMEWPENMANSSFSIKCSTIQHKLGPNAI